jgi:hypothetical protein
MDISEPFGGFHDDAVPSASPTLLTTSFSEPREPLNNAELQVAYLRF